MKVLVTGVEGYIGGLLAPFLVDRGHHVVGLDTGYYRDGWLYSDKTIHSIPAHLNKDLRHVTAEDFRGFDAVVHLAELSNDPIGKLRPEVTYRINHRGSIELARKAKEAGVERFIYNSSCSVYGSSGGKFLDEQAPTNPLTPYAQCKVMVERDVGQLVDETFSPVFFRCATAYGPSPRMRFDIVLNNLSGWAWTTKKIVMGSDGTAWRPFVHVLDVCKAMACALEAPRDEIHNQIFNLGDDRENYQVRDIAQIVAEEFPGSKVEMRRSGKDERSYHVSFDKILRELPGFRCERDARMGARQLHEIFERIDLSQETFGFRAFTRLKQLQYLIRTKQLDDELFWRH